MSTVSRYGSGPIDLGPLDLEWDEFMHYLYLPVRVPERDGGRRGLSIDCDAHRPAVGPQHGVPERLWFLAPVILDVLRDAVGAADHLFDPYVYVTARRGYATPGNPLNRPGFHCDDFGGTDLNYIWSDTYPTRFLRTSEGWPLAISDDDEQSMKDMASYATEAHAWASVDAVVHPRVPWIEDGPAGHLLRLDPYVVHDTPIIPAPGGMRSFFKISVSSHRYNLRGNSHNHLLDYDWPMYDRDQPRNQPQGGNRDYYKEAAS